MGESHQGFAQCRHPAQEHQQHHHQRAREAHWQRVAAPQPNSHSRHREHTLPCHRQPRRRRHRQQSDTESDEDRRGHRRATPFGPSLVVWLLLYGDPAGRLLIHRLLYPTSTSTGRRAALGRQPHRHRSGHHSSTPERSRQPTSMPATIGVEQPDLWSRMEDSWRPRQG